MATEEAQTQPSTDDQPDQAVRRGLEGEDGRSAAALIYRFYGHQIVYPGQGGMNPCWYCKWMYRGRFTLQTGCLFIGSALIVYGALWLFMGSVRIGAIDDNTDATSDERIKTLILVNAILTLIDSILFLLLPGAVLIFGAFRLHKQLCFAYSVIMALGMGFSLVSAVTVMVLVTTLPDGFADTDVQISLIFLVLAFKILDEAFRLYCLFCGYGLVLQIRSGEYEIPSPPVIASTYAIRVQPNIKLGQNKKAISEAQPKDETSNKPEN